MPPQSPSSSATLTEPPPLTRSSTLPVYTNPNSTGRSLLAPEDAISSYSPPKQSSLAVKRLQDDLRMTSGSESRRRSRNKDRNRSGSRRRKGTWKKLLWVKQSYPDNYTDQETFLEHLQRNPKLQPYDFWPLVADSTVIVQHVCSVVIFIVCFVGIIENRISPVAVVGWGSIATVLGWVLWDWWVGQEVSIPPPPIFTQDASASSSMSNLNMGMPNNGGLSARNSYSASATSIHSALSNLNPQQSSSNLNTGSLSARHSHSASASSIHSTLSNPPQSSSNLNAGSFSGRHSHSASASSMHSVLSNAPAPRFNPTYPPNFMSHRTSLRLSTAKSALLIYFTLLGLSPILKSLTLSTSSDSIWAMSFLLFTINIFFFDYGTPAPSSSINAANKNIPASLSTNAALMASTVLASRLPSTGQVFSLTLFSIEVFGLFPVFRRYARQRSWRGHVALTSLLVCGAGGGVGLILGHGGDGDGILDFPYIAGLTGLSVGILVTALAMGGCSWWLIGLQKYKNEIHGPWDPARPVIRGRWDDY